MSTFKLTRALIEGVESEAKDVILKDSTVPGLWVKITPNGSRLYVCYYRNARGEQRKPTLGRHGQITLEQARDAAKKILAEVMLGRDPSAERREKRTSQTVAEFFAIYQRDHSIPHKKPSSVEHEKYSFRHLSDAFGKKKLEGVTQSDVARLMARLADRPIMANRVRALASTMYECAARWGYFKGVNPCRHVKKYRERGRQRYLSAEELMRLGATVADLEEKRMLSWQAAGAIRMLILTGCRRGEILFARWADVDLDKRVLNLRDSKTGPRPVLLNEAAIHVLDNLPRAGEFIFPSDAKPGAAMMAFRRSWKRVCDQAALEDFHTHDLRHCHASLGVQLGVGLPILKTLLGHARISTTERYSHVSNDPARAASEAIGKEIADLMNGKGAEVVELVHAPAAKSKKAVSIGA